MCCSIAQAVVVNSSLGVSSVRELVALGKSNPGKLTYGSIGNGSLGHIYMEVLKRRTGMDMLHVPYKGAAPGITDLLGGRISVMITNPSSVQEHLASKKLRALAVGSAKRSTAFPDLPTTAEAGFAGWQWEFWQGWFAPAGTPKDVVSTLGSTISRIMASDQFNERYFKPHGIDAPHVTTSDEFAQFIRSDRQTTGPMIESTGIKLD
jgi:tripartite-type tricarboxylate transporter receptor subunit TctC